MSEIKYNNEYYIINEISKCNKVKWWQVLLGIVDIPGVDRTEMVVLGSDDSFDVSTLITKKFNNFPEGAVVIFRGEKYIIDKKTVERTYLPNTWFERLILKIRRIWRII